MTQKVYQYATTGIIVFTIAALIAWDIVAFVHDGNAATISQISLDFMWAHPALCLALGALVGHLTWSSAKEPNWPREICLLVFGLVMLLAFDLFSLIPPMMPLWPFLFGIPAGHVLFAQQYAVVERLFHGRRH